MKSVFLFFFFTAFALFVKAGDPVSGNFLTLKKSYSFELPMFDLSFELPANAGFRVPFWDSENALLNINERNVSYCCNKAAILSGDAEFTFSLPTKNEKALALVIEHTTVPDMETTLEKIRQSDIYLSDLPPLKGKLGTYYGFLASEGDLKLKFYLLQNEKRLIMFTIYSENKQEIAQCENIIKSINAVDLKEKRDEYLQTVKNENFEKQENPGSNSFISDTTQVETTFSFSKFGLQMLFPKDWIYRFSTGKGKIIHDKNKVEIHWNINDFVFQEGLHFFIYNSDLSIFEHFYPRTDKSDEAIRTTFESQKEIKRFPVLIDGVEGEAVAVGTQSMPTVHIRLTLNTYIFQLTAINVTADNLQLLQSLISNIQISDEQKKGIPAAASNIQPLSQQLNIKAAKAKKLPVTEWTQKEPDVDVETIPVSFKDAGISFMFPLLYSTFCFPEENCVSGEDSIVVAGKPSADKGNLSVTTMDKDNENMISVALSALNGESDFDAYFETMVENWKTYSFINMKRTEFALVNGQKWGVMEYVQSGKPVCMIMTVYNDCLVTVSCQGDSKPYKTLVENMLFTFSKTTEMQSSQ